MRIFIFRGLAKVTEVIALGLWRASTFFQNTTIKLLQYAVICPHGKNAAQYCRDCGDPPYFGEDK